MKPRLTDQEGHALSQTIKQHASELGFTGCAISDTKLDEHESHFLNWLNDGFHGEMHYMQKHGTKRSRPQTLIPGTIRVISVKLDYFPPGAADPLKVLQDSQLAYVSRYALGRDYHKVMRSKLKRLAEKITETIGPFGYRCFVDSAPVLEKALAEKAGLGWIGKHSNLLSTDAGSWFFLGEIYTDLPLIADSSLPKSYCGTCTQCITDCPTGAIVAPYRVDARKCISYHTIELKGPIPIEYRKAIGNRIYGCDDCQLVCPFTKFKNSTQETDFSVRHKLDQSSLVSLFYWSEEDFIERMSGSAIYRIGYERWLRNIAVALGNAETHVTVVEALKYRLNYPSTLVKEHVEWALSQHEVP